MAASSNDYQARIMFDDNTTLFDAKASVLGPESFQNTLVGQRVFMKLDFDVYEITYSHQGDGLSHQICQEDPTECHEFVDNSFTKSVTLRVNPLLRPALVNTNLFDPKSIPQFFIVNGKAIEAVLLSNGTLAVIK